MKRKTWVLAGAAVLAVAVAVGGVVVMSGGKQATSAAQRAAGEHRAGGKRELSAMVSVDGTLTYRARTGRLAVLRDQPGQRDIHRAARARPGDLSGPGALPGERQPGGAAVRLDTCLSDPVGRGDRPRRGRAQRDLVALGYATPAQLSPTSASFGSATTTAVEKLQAALGMTQNGTLTLGQAVFEPTAVRVTSRVSPARGQRPDRPDGDAGHLDHSPGAGGVGRLAADRRGGRGQGDASPCPTTRPPPVSSPRWGRSPPARRARGPAGRAPAPPAPGTDTCSSSSSGSSTTPTITVDVTPSDPAATGTWDQAPVQVGITTASVPSALVVPVTALLAQSGGGYAVEVVGAGGTNHLVAVSLGLFDDADGLVQVTGSGLAAGQEVVVPAT